MKIIGFSSSPRKRGNTATLVNAVLTGAAGKGAETRLIHLYDMEMQGCLDCNACKANLGKCAQKDDLSPLLEELTDFDAIVLGTPVYWYHINPLLKILIDRLNCFYGWEKDPESGETVNQRFEFPQGKKIIFVTSRGDAENTEVFPQFYDYLSEWLEAVATILGASRIEILNQYGSQQEKDSAKNDTKLIARAESLGESLV